MKIRKPPLDYYLGLLEHSPVLRFSRWGDGEWTAVLDKRKNGANCDGHKYFDDLRQALSGVLRGRVPASGHIHGMQPLALRLFEQSILEFLKGCDSTTDWHDADVFHRASIEGRIQDVFRAVRTCRTILVGPGYLGNWASSPETLGIADFIEVRSRDCWLDRRETLSRICGALERLAGVGRSLVALSCSMMAEVLIDDLSRVFPDRHLFVDFGSLWDPYAGHQTRKYHKELVV